MVHNRFNERETHPNKHVNFITAQPAPGVPEPYSEEDARHLLRALAAQVRPIMKSHGFAVNSFEEYEYNKVFAGRNWNNGETATELVLRRADGTFVSIPWLLSTFCHELAHIKYMNHGRDFQRLWAQLRIEVRALQERGYFGDGYWSSGTRVSDSARIGGQGIEDNDLPEYVCGGAQTRSRPQSLSQRKRVQRRVAGPSKHTGAQVEKKRKPGTRVKVKGAFKGEGLALNADINDEETKAKGTGFRKSAGSKRAREERALAAERRMKALQGNSVKTEEQETSENEKGATESDSEYEGRVWEPAETDEGRRKTMRNAMKDDELNSSRQFMKDFLSESKQMKNKTEVDDIKFANVFNAIELLDDEASCDLPSTSNPVVPRASKISNTEDMRPAKRPRKLPPSPQPTAGSSRSSQNSSKPDGLGCMVREEIATRKKETLGMAGGRKLGSSNGPAFELSEPKRAIEGKPLASLEGRGAANGGWPCLVCTLDNLPNHLACSACGTPRGDTAWPH